MNILIYIPELNQSWGGIRQYSLGLLNLAAQDDINNYIVYHNSNDTVVLDLISKNPQFKLVTDSDVCFRKTNFIKKKYIRLHNRVSRIFSFVKEIEQYGFIDTLCVQYEIGIIHCPYQYIPYASKAKLITTLHDVQEIHYPECFSAEIRAYRANAYLDFLRRADKVIVSYDHVKKDLIKYFNVSSEQINVLLLKMDNLWFDKFTQKDIVDLSHFNLSERFLLYPANTWQHKNHMQLIEAVAYLRDRSQIKINLVCSGHKNENFARINKLIEKLNLSDQVSFLGIVSEEELYSLYKTCHGTVIPTAYEAGSFPLYESILLDVPVICSDVTSLPETIGSEEFTFDPSNIEIMAEKIKALWLDEGFRSRNLNQIKLQAEKIKANNPLPVLQYIYKSFL